MIGLPSCTHRFKGMQATIASNNPQHFCVAEAAGLQTSSMLSTTSSSSSLDEQPTPGISLPSAELVAKQALQELGEPCMLPVATLAGAVVVFV